MTKHAPIPIEQITEAANWRQVREGLDMTLEAAQRMPEGRRALGEALCATLDTCAAGAPAYTAFGDIREDANWWADCATPVEVELYLAATLRRVHRLNRAGMAENARKRVFMELWNAMPEKDQGAFMRKVAK